MLSYWTAYLSYAVDSRCEKTASGVHRIREPFDCDFSFKILTFSRADAHNSSLGIVLWPKKEKPFQVVYPMEIGSSENHKK